MSQKYGKNLVPCMRQNGEIMMRINVEPVVLSLEDIVWDLSIEFDESNEIDEIKKITKKELKRKLKFIAQYRAYNYGGREAPNFWTTEGEQRFEAIKFETELLVLKWFPNFKGDLE